MVVAFADLSREAASTRAQASLWLRRSPPLVAAVACVLGSCADGGRERPDFSVGVAAEWTPSPATAAQLGYSILDQRPTGSARSCVGFNSCAAWPSESIGPVFVEVIP
jgi:hypothetical protein